MSLNCLATNARSRINSSTRRIHQVKAVLHHQSPVLHRRLDVRCASYIPMHSQTDRAERGVDKVIQQSGHVSAWESGK